MCLGKWKCVTAGKSVSCFMPLLQTFLMDFIIKETLETLQKLQPFLDTEQPGNCLDSFSTEESLRNFQALEPWSSSLCKPYHPLLKYYEDDALIPISQVKILRHGDIKCLAPSHKLVKMDISFNPGQFAWRACALVTWQCWLLTLFTNNIHETRSMWEGEAGMKNIWITQMKLITPFDPVFFFIQSVRHLHLICKFSPES